MVVAPLAGQSVVKVPPDHEFAIPLQGERGHRAIRAAIKRGVDGAVRVEPCERNVRTGGGEAGRLKVRERTPDDNFVVGQHQQRVHGAVRIWVEAGLDRAAIRIEAGEAVARHRADGGERAADKNLAVGLQREGEDGVVQVRVEGGVERAIGFEAQEPVAREAGRGARHLRARERAADQNFPIRLERDRVNLHVGELVAEIRVKTRVGRPVGIETRDAIASRATHAGEGRR